MQDAATAGLSSWCKTTQDSITTNGIDLDRIMKILNLNVTKLKLPSSFLANNGLSVEVVTQYVSSAHKFSTTHSRSHKKVGCSGVIIL